MEEKSTKEILDFLLNSYRAKLAIQDPGGNCSFDFANSFLLTWKCEKWDELRESLLEKLNPLLREGLLDSILPYLTSSFVNQIPQVEPRVYSDPVLELSETSSITPIRDLKKSSRSKDASLTAPSEDYEIVIHVCDEAKGVKEDFRCLQSILIKEMSYFSRVTIKGQRLRDMDISVHCDIGVFDWLMKWINEKYGTGVSKLKLEPSNVIGLVVSADFLQMTDLTNECLLFIFENIGQVIANSPNLGCLSDALTARLSTFIDNSEMERRIVKLDKNDRIISKLYIQFILSLNDTEPNMSRGHFASTASLFKCELCSQLLINEIAPKIPCNLMKFDARGRIFSNHTKSPNWCLATHIRDLKKELRTWRRVYWRLWGTVHFFYCSLCHMYFAAKDLGTCRFHPDPPKFSLKEQTHPNDGEIEGGKKKSFNEEEERNRELPFGKFPCCKQPAYLYSPLPQTNGCQLRDHTVDLYSHEDANLVRMMSFRDLVVQSFPFNTRFDWSSVIQLGLGGGNSEKPPNVNPLMTKVVDISEGGGKGGKENMIFPPNGYNEAPTSSESDSEELNSEYGQDIFSKSRNSGINLNSRYYDSWVWNNELTTRYNQDMQREKEEKIMIDLSAFLSQRIPLDSSSIGSQGVKFGFRRVVRENLGGSFVKLENSWRDQNQYRINRSSSKL